MGVKSARQAVVSSCIHQASTAFPGENEQAHDGVPIQARKPLGAANGATFDKALHSADRYIFAGAHGSKGRCRASFGKHGMAGNAAVTLNTPLAVGSKLLSTLVLASDTRHGFSPLCVLRRKPYNLCGSGVWLTPRSGLAGAAVSAAAPAHFVKVYPLGWINGYFHRWTVSSEANHDDDSHCVPPFSCRSARNRWAVRI